MERIVRLVVALLFVCLTAAFSNAKAAAAVAVWVEAKTGKWEYGYWKGAQTEAEAKSRALRACASMGGVNPTILASTSKRGYGAIVLFDGPDKKPRFAVALAASSEHQATKIALQKARDAGGRYARVLRTWNDGPDSEPPVIKLR